jgi:hypothetical protein
MTGEQSRELHVGDRYALRRGGNAIIRISLRNRHDRLKRACSPATSDEAVGRITASPCHDDALADALAETLGDVWARLGLALKHSEAAPE